MSSLERAFLYGVFTAWIPLGRIFAWLGFLFLCGFAVYFNNALLALFLALFEYRYLRRRFRS